VHRTQFEKQSQIEPMKWNGYPNLQARPLAPARGKGRLQRQIRRAFIAASGRPDGVPMSIFLDFCYPHKRLIGKRLSRQHQYSIWRTLMAVAEPVGRAKTIGRPILWRLRTTR